MRLSHPCAEEVTPVVSTSSVKDMLALLDRGQALLDSILRETIEPNQRAHRLAEGLRSLWPSAPLYFCWLRGDHEDALSAIDERGEPSAEWADLVRREMDKSDSISKVLQVQHLRLAWEPICFQGHKEGMLAIALPDGIDEESDLVLRSLLVAWSRRLAPCLRAECLERERETLQRALKEQMRLADVGEIVGPVAHEFNNLLKILLLQLAVLKLTAPDNGAQGLTEVRRQGIEAAAMIRRLQHYRHSQPPPPRTVDLNAIVRATVEELSREDFETGEGRLVRLIPENSPSPVELSDLSRIPVSLRLTASLAPFMGSFSDVKRLCTFLLKNAAGAASETGGRVILLTESITGKAVLRVEDTGSKVQPEVLGRLFEPHLDVREGTNGLELAACQALVRHLGGNIHAESGAEGGLTIRVVLPAPTA
jgi:signal transduction histidine kinase